MSSSQVRVRSAVALPEPGPDKVVVTTHVSGISGGTELLAYRSEIDPGCGCTLFAALKELMASAR